MVFDKSVYQADYRIKNKQKITEYQSRYRIINKEKSKFQCHCYGLLHADDESMRWLVRKEIDKDKLKAYNKIKAQRPESKAYCRNYSKTSPRRPIYLARMRKQGRSNYKKLRYEIFSAYSNGVIQCNCCGELEYDFLTIDHIKSKKASNHDRTMGAVKLYRFLKKHNFPTGYQILCFNCNLSKHMRDYCSHEKNRVEKFTDVYLRNKKFQNKLKLEVLSYYSKGIPYCECCSETDIDFLGMDHINGRKKYGHKQGFGGYRLHLWLRNNDFPNDFRVLCYNCNMYIGMRSNDGLCIHERNRISTRNDANIENFMMLL